MSSTVTTYAQSIIQPLEGLYTSFTQLAGQHRNMNDRLRSHHNDLVSNSTFAFQGSGATAFSSLVTYYLGASEKHMQVVDDAASAIQSCHSTIITASSSADAAGLHPELTNHVLSQVTPNDIILSGSSPIQTVISSMESSLHDLASDTGGVFGNLIHAHLGAAFGSLIHAGGDIKHMAGDALSLLENIGRVLGNWATSVYDAVNKCVSFIGSAIKAVTNFYLSNFGNMRTIVGTLGKILSGMGRTELSDFLFKKTLHFMGLSLLLNILQGKDKTAEQFFSDLNGQMLSLIPGVGTIGFVFGATSTASQLLGGAEQNLLAPLFAKSDPALAKELGKEGQILNKDGKSINLGAVFRDLGDADYNLNFGNERGDVQLWHQLSHDKFLSPQFDKDLSHGLPGAVLGATTGGILPVPGTTHSDRGAALHSLGKAGEDLGSTLEAVGKVNVDLAKTGKNITDAAAKGIKGLL